MTTTLASTARGALLAALLTLGAGAHALGSDYSYDTFKTPDAVSWVQLCGTWGHGKAPQGTYRVVHAEQYAQSFLYVQWMARRRQRRPACRAHGRHCRAGQRPRRDRAERAHLPRHAARHRRHGQGRRRQRRQAAPRDHRGRTGAGAVPVPGAAHALTPAAPLHEQTKENPTMLDLLITHATLPDGRTGMSIAVQDGRIAEVAEGLAAPAHETIDAAACCWRRTSSTRISTWTPRSATACRASTKAARCSKASRCGAS
jgi:hypothetical protein